VGDIGKIEHIAISGSESVGGVDVSGIAKIEGQDVPSAIEALFDVVISGGKTTSFSMTLPSGKTVYVDWDDGDGDETYNGTGSPQTVGNTYSGAGTYNCVMTGDIDFITAIQTFSTPLTDIGGNLMDFISPMTALTTFDTGYGTSWSGGFSGIPTTMTYLNIQNTDGITGDLTDLASSGPFTNIDLSEDDYLSISSALMPDCSSQVYLFSDSLDSTDGDRVVIGMDDAGCASGGYLWMWHGRTSASDTEAASLVTKGWTVDVGS